MCAPKASLCRGTHRNWGSGRNPSSSNSTVRRSTGRVRLLLGFQPRLIKPRIFMRDWLLAIITVALIPLILRSPFVGLLAWVWFAIMNPHRLAFGWARDFPFSLLISLCAFASLVLNLKQLRKP